MNEKQYGILFVIIAVTLIGILTARIAYAVSIADNIAVQTGANSSNNVTSASAGASSSNNNNASIILTASADRGEIKAGSTQTIHIRAITSNGTAIADLPVQVLVRDYATGNEKLLLAGQTNSKGETDVSAPIPTSSKTGQFFVVINAEKDGVKSTISTGFAVDGKGSNSSSSSSSRCSGSSCR